MMTRHHIRLMGVTGAACTVFAMPMLHADGGMPVQAYPQPVAPMQPAAVEDNGFDLGVALNSDSFFGFYPSFAGSYSFSDAVDFTAYGIFWAAGEAGGGFGDWTEFGGGLSFNVSEYLSINPQIGFTFGSLLSSGAAGLRQIDDGWVPNLTINWDSPNWEGQLYSGLYLPLSDEGSTLEFLHSWINMGYKLNSVFSVGGHLEQLNGGSSFGDETFFTWAGPYVQFRNENTGVFARLAGGVAFNSNDNQNTFWKASVGFSF